MTYPSAESRAARAAIEAADWSQRLDAEKLSIAERREFVDWLRESPLHVAEMLRLGQLESTLAKFDGWDRIPPAADIPEGSVIPFPPRDAARDPIRRRRMSPRQWLAGVAAALVLATVATVVLQHAFGPTVLRTQAGERREITLADGSIIRLSPNTELRVDLQPHKRLVAFQRGEAVFHVAKDHARPFVVDATTATAQAVGTVFSVARDADSVEVTVTEGQVAVTPVQPPSRELVRAPGASALLLSANERVSVSAHGAATPVLKTQTAARADWGVRELTFDNISVADVVAQFNRRNRVQIRIDDSALALRTVSGVFDAGDPQSFVDFLQAIAGTTVIGNGPNEIVVVPFSAVSGAAPTSR